MKVVSKKFSKDVIVLRLEDGSKLVLWRKTLEAWLRCMTRVGKP